MSKSTGTKRTGLGKGTTKSSDFSIEQPKVDSITFEMSNHTHVYETTIVALCIKKKANIDLIAGRIYKVLVDLQASKDGFVRVVDESGEDYLYPLSYFELLTVKKTSTKHIFR